MVVDREGQLLQIIAEAIDGLVDEIFHAAHGAVLRVWSRIVVVLPSILRRSLRGRSASDAEPPSVFRL
jgi:L-lysine 2,3-aminomutase